MSDRREIDVTLWSVADVFVLITHIKEMEHADRQPDATCADCRWLIARAEAHARRREDQMDSILFAITSALAAKEQAADDA